MAINPREERRRDNESGSDGEEESLALLRDCDLIGRERERAKRRSFLVSWVQEGILIMTFLS